MRGVAIRTFLRCFRLINVFVRIIVETKDIFIFISRWEIKKGTEKTTVETTETMMTLTMITIITMKMMMMIMIMMLTTRWNDIIIISVVVVNVFIAANDVDWRIIVLHNAISDQISRQNVRHHTRVRRITR